MKTDPVVALDDFDLSRPDRIALEVYDDDEGSEVFGLATTRLRLSAGDASVRLGLGEVLAYAKNWALQGPDEVDPLVVLARRAVEALETIAKAQAGRSAQLLELQADAPPLAK